MRRRRRIDGDVIPLVADVGTAEGGAAFIAEAERRLGAVDIVVANCGGPPGRDLRQHRH